MPEPFVSSGGGSDQKTWTALAAVWNSCQTQEEAVSACSTALRMAATEVREHARLLVRAGLLRPLPVMVGGKVLTDEHLMDFLLVWGRATNAEQVARVLQLPREEVLRRAKTLRTVGVALRDLPDAQLEDVPLPDVNNPDVATANQQLALELAIRRAMLLQDRIRQKMNASVALIASVKKRNKVVDPEVVGAVALLEDVLRDIGVVR